MEEGKEDNKQHKIVASIGASWIICRSQTHSGRIYYFNTLTGKAVWNLSDSEMKKAHLRTLSIQGQAATNIENCPEPMEPPTDMPQNVGYEQTPGGPRIYNKLIINDQFGKPFTVSPFANPLNYNSLNNMSNASVNVVPPVYNTNMWTVPPTQPVFLTPVVNPFANQPLLNNIGLQSQPVGLSNTFQVINDFAKNGLYQGTFNNTLHQNLNARMNQRVSQNFQNNSTHDLRNVLSAMRKVSLDKRDIRIQGTCNDSGNCQDVANINEADLYPSDIDDEWLQANTSDVKNKLNVNVSSLWGLANGYKNKDCWFIVVSAMVLLNHMKFLTSLIDSDDSVRLLAPGEVRRRLRSAPGAGAAALPQRARRASRFAAQQMNRIPPGIDSCQNGSIVHCCMELVQRNYYVIHLTDDSDFEKSETELQKLNDVPVFTVNDLKQYLTQNSYVPAVELRNVTVTVSPENHGYKHPGAKATPNTKENPKALAKEDSICTPPELPSPKTKEIEKAEQNSPPRKRTVNASVQTDLTVEPTPSSVSKNSSHLETVKINHSFDMDVSLQSDSSKEEKNVVKKIKLIRGQSLKKEDSVKRPFKWRKSRAAPSDTSVKDPMKYSAASNDFKFKQSNSSPLSFSDLIQQNDNAVDYGQNMEIVKESVADDKDASTSGVISDSVESDSMFKLNRKAIRSDSSYYEKDIVMFEVTGDQMDDHLSKGCDEWLSRFVQIMEEALSQILQQEPAFVDHTLPPPWNVHEATLCIGRRFNHNANVSYACNKLLAVLHKISDDKGKIHPNLDPSSFMQMYSYGVNLIEALKSELQDSEDVQIAMESLSKLLSDIRNPNLDGSHNVFTDTFNFDDGHIANSTETRKEDGVISGEESKKGSPRKKPQQVSSKHSSPSKYNLRSIEQKNKSELVTVKTTDKESSFFTGLGLRKNVHVDGPAIKISIENSETNVPPSPELPETIDDRVEPKIIRIFNRCIDYEEKLKKRNLQFDCEFTEDNMCSGGKFYLEDDYSDGIDEGQSPGSGDIDASIILKWFVERSTYPVHRLLVQIHKFCTDAKEQIKYKDKLDGEYKTSLFEKTTKLSTHLGSLCKHLNSILQCKDIKSKFRDMMRELQIEDFVMDAEMDDVQAADYNVIIGKYLVQAGNLLECVNDIADLAVPSLE